MRKFYTKFPGAKLTEPLWGAVAGVQEGQVLISRVSRHSVRSLGKLQQTEQRGYHPQMQRIWYLASGLHSSQGASDIVADRRG